MMARLRRWLAPPVFPGDESKSRRAILLNSIALTCSGLALLLVAGNLVGGHVPVAVNGVDLLAVAVCLCARYWAGRGGITLAGVVLLAFGLLAVTAVLALLGTIRAPAAGMYMLLVITGGLLFEVRGLVTMALLCSLSVAGLILAENAGLLARPDYDDTITQWIASTVLAAWAGSLTLSALRSTRHALARARAEITIREQAEAELRAALAEKEVLVKEIQHRVRNNLASVCALIDLQRAIPADPASAAELTKLRGRVHSMALVYELVHQSATLDRIEAQQYLTSLVAQLRLICFPGVPVDVRVEAADVILDLDTAVPCGLVMNELVSNALDHAFPEGCPCAQAQACEVVVRLAWDGGRYLVTVSDNGVGLPPDFDWTKATSLGLKLVAAVGRGQLGARVEVESAQGTVFRLQFAPLRR